MRDYLEDFHKHKEVFLRFRATKSTKAAVKVASKDLRVEHHCLLVSDELRPATPSKQRKLQQELQLETEELVNETLTSSAHYNFLKMHLISHFVEQIAKYGSLPQYSTEICEASHKPLRDAYCRSNHINALPQILRSYTRAHHFAMRERNLVQWISDLSHMPDEIRSIIHPTHKSLHLSSDAAPELTRYIYNLETLEKLYQLLDVRALTMTYLACNHYAQSSNLETDVTRLQDAPLEAFHTLQVVVPTFNGKLFRNQDERHDWVFVRRRKLAQEKVPSGLDGRVPAKLNTLFKLGIINARWSRGHSARRIAVEESCDKNCGYRGHGLPSPDP
ncbi:hypothetical protein BGX38DRAFT_1146612 [Terfezia claveryi]|nr:hypothetical protein BGX38DRAFT_1146612 [Terfezia claveryi]